MKATARDVLHASTLHIHHSTYALLRQVFPLPSDPLAPWFMADGTSAVIVDDKDGLILYDGDDWFDLSTSNQAVKDGTLSQTQGPGSFSTVFIGSQITVYGTVSPMKQGKPPEAVKSVYIVDGVVLGTYTAPNLTQEADGVQFWTSGLLDVLHHRLVVNVTNASEDYPFSFDYLIFEPPPTLTSQIFTSSSASPTSSGLTNGISFSASSTSTSSSSSSSSSDSSGLPSPTAPSEKLGNTSGGPHSNVGPIVGGVIGGTGVILLVLLAFLYWWRKKKRSALPQDIDSIDDSPIREVPGGMSGITPFLLPRDYNTSSASVVPRETAAPIAPVITGAVAIPTSSKARLAASSPQESPSYLYANEGSSQRHLMALAPSERSSASGSGNRPHNQHSGSWLGDGTDESGSAGAGRAQSPKGSHAPASASSHSSEAPQPRIPNVHADSGLRFPAGQMPNVADEVSSEAPTEFPPAYTPS